MDSSRYFIKRLGTDEGPYCVEELRGMIVTGYLPTDTIAKRETGGDWFPVKQIPNLYSQKQWIVAIILAVFLGNLGIDRFYVGHIGLGILKVVTLGGCGVWHIVDIVLFAMNKVSDDKGLPLRPN
jgi:hypothetical protein